MATISNLYIDQGTSYSTIIDVNDDTGVAFDLTGYTIKAQIRKTYTSSTSTPFVASSPAAGKIQLELDDSVTINMKAGRYVYDVIITNATLSNTLRVIEGILTINPGVSR
jgi:hypothetical protein